MRIVGVAFACVLLGGCTIKTGYTSPDPNPPTVRRLHEPEPVVHHRREAKPRGPELVPLNVPRERPAERREAKVATAPDLTESCAEDRAERLPARVEYDAWRARLDAALAWEAEHCVVVDHAKDTLITEMDHAGRISQRVALVGPTSLRCDASDRLDSSKIRMQQPHKAAAMSWRINACRPYDDAAIAATSPK